MTSRILSLNSELYFLFLSTDQKRCGAIEHGVDTFGESLKDKMEQIVQSLSNETRDIHRTAEEISSRLQAFKGSDMTSWCNDNLDESLKRVEETMEQYSKIKETTDKILSFCTAFGVETPNFDNIARLEEELKPFSCHWELFKEYRFQLDVIARADWIRFRSNLVALEDFCATWESKIEQRAGNAPELLAKHIYAELQSIRNALPALKYCIGSSFKDAHWVEFLQGRLNLPKTVRLENLCCSHLLQCLEKIAEHDFLDFVKRLNSR